MRTVKDYEIRKDVDDENNIVWDVYAQYDGDSEWLETFYTKEEAEKYVAQQEAATE